MRGWEDLSELRKVGEKCYGRSFYLKELLEKENLGMPPANQPDVAERCSAKSLRQYNFSPYEASFIKVVTSVWGQT